MAELTHCSETGDSLSDFLVCSALRYLDSSTSYREYLGRMHDGKLQASGFVVLDDQRSNWSQTLITVAVGILVSAICLVWLRG